MNVKFGIQIEPQFGFDYNFVEQIALEGEKIGFDSIWFSDHLFLDDKSETTDCMEAWTLLAALASKTEKIRLGALVTCNSYRYPAVLAKIAATVDRVSNGRVIFGIGAGWKEIEYNAYGIPFPSLKERMDRLEEAIQIIKLLWTEPKVSFSGKYYTVKDAFSSPKPVQNPMPFLIGGGGEKRTLKMVAKYADQCNLFGSPEVKHKLTVLRQHCQENDTDYDHITKSIFGLAFVTESDEKLNSFFEKRAKQFNRSVDEERERAIKDLPGSWFGYPEQVIERYQYFIDLGCTYFQVLFPGKDEEVLRGSQSFAKLVMNRL